MDAPEEKKGEVRENEERGREEGGRRENEEKSGGRIFGERFSRARVDAHRCAHSNRNVVFLLSQVSHQDQKAKSKQPKFWRRRQNKTALFQVLSTEFWELGRVIC